MKKKKKKKKNKKIKNLNLLLPISIIIILLFLMIIALIASMISNMKPVSKKEYINQVVKEVFYDKDLSIEKLENTLNEPMINEVIFIGKDSALRYKPSEDIIKTHNLQKYVDLQEKYAAKVEKKAKQEIEYRIIKQEDNSIVYKIKPWYIYKYSYDLNILKELIMENAGFVTKEKNVFGEDYNINEFKARVIALKILDKHLNDYNNTTNETLELNMFFDGAHPREAELLSLYYNLEGVTSKTSPNRMTQEEKSIEVGKMQDYLDAAEEEGLFNRKKPYKI